MSVFLESMKAKMENEVHASIDAAIIKLADQARVSTNDGKKALEFSQAVESLSQSRLNLQGCKPIVSSESKKN